MGSQPTGIQTDTTQQAGAQPQPSPESGARQPDRPAAPRTDTAPRQPGAEQAPAEPRHPRRLTAMLADIAPLRESPAFRRLWVSQLLSGFGGQMTTVAVLFQVWKSTGSAAWTGAIGLAQAVPLIAFGLFAGALADRLDRRRFYLVCTVGQGVCSALLATQALFGTFAVGLVLLMVAAQSLFGAGSNPTARTFLPHLVRTEHMGAASSRNASSP